jgi:hypothetical protein
MHFQSCRDASCIIHYFTRVEIYDFHINTKMNVCLYHYDQNLMRMNVIIITGSDSLFESTLFVFLINPKMQIRRLVLACVVMSCFTRFKCFNMNDYDHRATL